MSEVLQGPPTGFPGMVEQFGDNRFNDVSAVVLAEIARYDNHALPDVLVAERIEIAGTPAIARFLTELELVVLAPALDLRGNLHRAMAESLLEANPEAAAEMRTSWSQESEGTLYGGRLSAAGEQAALIAAAVTNRTSLDSAASVRPALADNLAIARHFLDVVDLGKSRRSDEPPAPVAWLSQVTGSFPDFVASPGDVPVRLAPVFDKSDEYNYEYVDATHASEIVEGFARDIWILPEGLLEASTAQVCVVEDVSHPRTDVGGYAWVAEGERATIVIERKGRRRTFFHELGHALHLGSPGLFEHAAWDELSPASGYFGDAKEFIRTGVREQDFNPRLLRRGFITSYSSANMDEDVAELTEALLVGDDRLWACLEHAPIVAAKTDLLIVFLQRIDPLLTRDYFRLLATERVVQEAAWSR